MGAWNATSKTSPQGATTTNALRAMAFAVISTISALSFISHKEVRFIYPLVPVLHLLAAPQATDFFTHITEGGIPTSSGRIGVKRKPLLLAALFVNVTIAVYLGWFHGAAPMQVMSFLRHDFEQLHPKHLDFPLPINLQGYLIRNETEPLELFALFLTPCHTTPWRSHLLYPALRARALTCEPPLGTAPGSAERAAYVDEGRRFDADKVGFLSRELWPSSPLSEDIPRYIVGFEGIEDDLKKYFAGPGKDKGVTLTRKWSAWNGLFTDDERKAGELRVWDTGIYH
jgi:GPI mannosyltransferase 3